MNGQVIDIDKNQPIWQTAICICIACGVKWVSVLRDSTPQNQLECVACHKASGMIQAYVFREGRDG